MASGEPPLERDPVFRKLKAKADNKQKRPKLIDYMELFAHRPQWQKDSHG